MPFAWSPPFQLPIASPPPQQHPICHRLPCTLSSCQFYSNATIVFQNAFRQRLTSSSPPLCGGSPMSQSLWIDLDPTKWRPSSLAQLHRNHSRIAITILCRFIPDFVELTLFSLDTPSFWKHTTMTWPTLSPARPLFSHFIPRACHWRNCHVTATTLSLLPSNLNRLSHWNRICPSVMSPGHPVTPSSRHLQAYFKFTSLVGGTGNPVNPHPYTVRYHRDQSYFASLPYATAKPSSSHHHMELYRAQSVIDIQSYAPRSNFCL